MKITDDMIEQEAERLWSEEPKPPGPPLPPFNHHPQWMREIYLRKARAALEAALRHSDSE